MQKEPMTSEGYERLTSQLNEYKLEIDQKY